MLHCFGVFFVQELRLGCVLEEQVWEGPPIPLSGDEVEQHRYSPDLGKVLYLDGQVQLQLLLPPQTAGGLTQVTALIIVPVALFFDWVRALWSCALFW